MYGCGGCHHSAVCEVGSARNSDSSAVEGAAWKGQSEVATSAMHVGSSMHVFLQAAQVMVSQPGAEGTKSWNIHAMLDT